MSDEAGALAAAAARIADLERQLGDATQAAAQAKLDADARVAALQARFDLLYGDPVEDGIVRGAPPYVTSADGQKHDTLQDARVHLVALAMGIPDGRVKDLIKTQSGPLVDLIQRAAGEAP